MNRIIVIIAALLLAGCETTGDPTRGGLFGYSPKKAEARQQEYRETLEAASRDAEQAEKNQAELSSRLGEEEKNLRATEIILQDLLAERAQLETEYRDLLKKQTRTDSEKQVAEEDLALQQEALKLLEIEQARMLAPSQNNVERIRRENELLQKAIMTLTY